MRSLALGLVVALAAPASAEVARYGQVDLTGLTRNGWDLVRGSVADVMVCNVNGPDGFLSVRAGPGPQYPVSRSFNRLAVLTLNPHDRRGNWVRVIAAYRHHDQDGRPIPFRPLDVEGWAHDGYLCDFLD